MLLHGLTPDTLLALARRQAQQEHEQAIIACSVIRGPDVANKTSGLLGHKGAFETCPHPTCRLVREPERTVEKFINWVKKTPHGSLTGDSKIAYDAQVRVLDQLAWYMEGRDEYLDACINLAALPDPPAAAQETCVCGSTEFAVGPDGRHCHECGRAASAVPEAPHE